MSQKSTEPEATAAPERKRFDELGLSEPVLRAVRDKGYERPTPIQEEAIPVLLEGKDLIGGSQTGTGKTAAFALPILSRLGEPQGKPRVLILEPTRELARQVIEQFELYGKHLKIRSVLLHGGVGYGAQRDAMDKGVDIVVATPGRLLDHLGRRALTLKHVEVLVLDEADRMLDMGFLPDVRRIVDQCPAERQSLLFSATVPPEIERLARRMLQDPVKIAIGGGRSPAQTVNHAMYPVDDRQKFDLLNALLSDLKYRSILIFTRTKQGADTIARWLENAEHGPVEVLHSDRTQKMRDRALEAFKSGKSPILVATDIVARGIDIKDVSHVVNYDIPQNPEDYVHRIGRTGRAEQSGDAATILTAADVTFLQAIENFIGHPIEQRRIEGFDYKWSPVLDSGSPTKKKKRNRGFGGSVEPRWNRR